jgi:hypothetical protein
VHPLYLVRKTAAVGIGARDPGSTVDKQADPFGALTEQAESFDVPGGDLAEYLPPFAVGLTMVAGRALALVAYRDAERWGDRPLVRSGDDARGTVLA